MHLARVWLGDSAQLLLGVFACCQVVNDVKSQLPNFYLSDQTLCNNTLPNRLLVVWTSADLYFQSRMA